MKLNREGVALNTVERNKRNQNWTTLETEVTTVSDAVKEALPIAEEALGLSGNLQAQINTLVVEGDSSVEAKQARVDAKGVEAPTLKARLDAEQQATTQQLAEKAKETDLHQVRDRVNALVLGGVDGVIQEPFSGNGKSVFLFDQTMRGIVISNDSDSALTFKIHDYTLVINPGEAFQGVFNNFMKVEILSGGSFRGYGLSKDADFEGNPVLPYNHHYLINPNITTRSSSSNTFYKGSEFTVKQPIDLHSFGISGTPLNWSVWTTSETGILNEIISGIVTGEKDLLGYTNHVLENPIQLDVGNYVLITNFSLADSKFIQHNISSVLNNELLNVTGKAYVKSSAPGTISLDWGGAGDLIIDQRLGVSKKL